MNGVSPWNRHHTLARWGERILFMVGAGLVLWYGWAKIESSVFQARGREYFAAEYATGVATSPQPRQTSSFIGKIDVPTLGLSGIILEGSSAEDLRLGVGHIAGTALPGENGNVALAAHRDTFFRPLRLIHPHDEITLSTSGGTFRYEVDWTKIVGPKDTTVLRSSSRPILTLVTCYPFYFIGSAPKRFIVRAHQVTSCNQAHDTALPAPTD